MSADCQRCPHLQNQLLELTSAVRATAQLIAVELAEPTQARLKTLLTVHARLEAAAAEVGRS